MVVKSAPRRARVLVLVGLALLPAATRAQTAPAAADLTAIEARDHQAAAACGEGRLEEGVRVLAELFAETDDGNYIFNQARCYQQNGRVPEALARFRMYLNRPDADPAALARARVYIAELEAAPAAPALTEPAIAPEASLGHTLRRAGLITGGAGLGALAAATYFGMQTSTIEKEAAAAARANPERVDGLNREGKRAELLQWVFLGVGATAVSTGALLTYFGLRATSHRQASLTVLPMAWRRGAGAVLRLSFR
jgi:hypothetical protein